MTDSNKPNRSNQPIEAITIAFSTQDQPALVCGVPDELESPHDFEEAVQATGYGLFNYLLLLAILPAGLTNYFDTTTMPYILPSAECDLELTLFQKGVLNAAISAGMISSNFVWGFLADTKGRRSLLMFGFFADFICNSLSSLSQSFHVMVAFKFLSGCIISGPFVISMAYLAEFHGTDHRSKIMLWTRISPSIASVLLPGLAWLIIPQSWSLVLFEGAFVYNSWRIFILVSSLPPLLAFLTLLYFPESPRFLISQGRNDEALKIFQRIYAMNTGNPPESFPVKSLCQEGQKKQMERSASRKSISVWDKIRNGLAQFKPLFQKPYLCHFLLIMIIQFGSFLSMNTVKMWMPQLFTLMENFDYENHDPSLGNPTLCNMLTTSNFPNATANYDSNSTMMDTCVVVPVQSKVYINSIIIAVTSVIGCALAGNVINILGEKKILLLAYAASATCTFLLNWSPNSDATLALFAVYTALMSITGTVILSLIVELMPTPLRITAASLIMTSGRSGVMIGNLLFPILLTVGCMAPFIFIGGFLVVCCLLSIFIPKPPPKLM